MRSWKGTASRARDAQAAARAAQNERDACAAELEAVALRGSR